MSAEPAVRAVNLSRAYGAQTVLKNLTLSIAEGEFVALLGESGCGKTTLLRLLAGLDPVQSGQMTVAAPSAVVFQEHRLLPWKRLWENVALGLRDDRPRARAAQALAEVGLADRLDDWPKNLSGGQAQRVAIARAFVQSPKLLLLDEPFASLDALTRAKMHGLLKALVGKFRPGVLLVTHDVHESIFLADRILVMAEGRLTAEKRPSDYLDPLALHAELLDELGVSLDDHAAAGGKLQPGDGRAPDQPPALAPEG
ncbi:MAG: ABC transporter ATP-binding protein [Deltaproteobacteria bacterium]|jgi:sulfonate transport system ATP-binding protein|nr:ABC transporter ATP-binding protein [Deltaproteobacteria bacterium]